MLELLLRPLLFPGGGPCRICPDTPGLSPRPLRTATGGRAELLGPPPGDDRRPWQVLYFYGNAMTARECGVERDVFGAAGCDLWVPDYVGYGRTPGRPGEAGCRAAADAAHDHLTRVERVAPARLILAGWSLGAAVALDLATRVPAAGVIALSPFRSLAAMAERACGGLPVGWLFGGRFDNHDRVRRSAAPLLVVHGTDDDLIPCSHGAELAAAHPRGRFVPVAGAGHALFGAADEAVRAAVTEFLTTLEPEGGA